MYQTITFNDFLDAFKALGRDKSFTYEGFKALYDYLLEYEDSVGTKMELDVVALDGEFTEYKDYEEFKSEYTETAELLASFDELSDHTTVIEIPNSDSFIIQAF